MIPNTYSLADYFRFNSPHNDAHLAHLEHGEKTGIAYTDQLQERVYFEAIAVLSEYIFFEDVKGGGVLVPRLYEAFTPERKKLVSIDEFRGWLLDMRGFEFRLRALRLLSDVHIGKGFSASETIGELAKQSQIDTSVVQGEVSKYLEFFGLGSVYTIGYLSLLGKGIYLRKAMSTRGKVISTWGKLNKEYE